ncbi:MULTISPECIES: acyl carrier protein [Rhodopseudomonas]|uniref:Acyl carrier protein n=1 Tax=Rhodopseudomonas palustris TaxID=1076 RepID=A0A0D7F508_RHOPL|nr:MULTISPECIES: acyl carrier protein [Rhodopseudomonas]KIZ47876.1 acyl carrier protein [Rhodopseudomonas palustris]MDF3812583.1 acyl carrier protein [Rhodopseudomonas sp. BAL398]WOK17687.1 acyl carrier protein [Rhodopseudomonas sp. BAL398]
MNRAMIYETLTGIFRDVFDDETIILQPQTTAREIAGWDSQAMITLVVAVEDRFGISFRTSEIEQLDAVKDFVELIAAKCKIDA